MAKKSLQELLGNRAKKPIPASVPEKPKEEKKNSIDALFAQPKKEAEEKKSINLDDLFKPQSTEPPSTETKSQTTEKPTALIDTNNFTYEGQPEKLEAEVTSKFQEDMEILRQNIDDKGLVSQSLSNILQMIKQHSFLADNLADEDCGTMIRALKHSHSVVLLEKKSRGGGRAPSEKQKVQIKEAEDMLAGIDFGDI